MLWGRCHAVSSLVAWGVKSTMLLSGILKLSATQQRLTRFISYRTVVLHTLRGWRLKLGNRISGFIHPRVVAVPLGASEEAVWFALSCPARAVILAHATWKVTEVHSSLRLRNCTSQFRVLTDPRAKIVEPIKKVRLIWSSVLLCAVIVDLPH